VSFAASHVTEDVGGLQSNENLAFYKGVLVHVIGASMTDVSLSRRDLVELQRVSDPFFYIILQTVSFVKEIVHFISQLH